MSGIAHSKAGILLIAALALGVRSSFAAELGPADFLKVDGMVLKREGGKGAVVTLRGTNLGGWFVQEGWMSPNGYGAIARDGWLASGSGANPAAALDGDAKTAWTAGPAKEGVDGFTLHLGRLTAFDRVALAVGQADGDLRQELMFEVSKDGANWTPALAQRTETVAGEWLVSLDQMYTARELRIRRRGEAFRAWSVAEINLHQNDDFTVRMALQRRFGRKVADELLGGYQDAWFGERDLDNIRDWGMNVVRIPMNWLEFVEPDGVWKANAWTKLDRVIRGCGARHIYVILDLHAAPGGASPWASSGRAGDDGTGQNPNGFWTDPRCQELTGQIWTRIAEHYRGNPAVAGYDLVNEPVCSYDERPGKGEQYSAAALKKSEMFDRLYRAVRAVDPDHIIFVAAFMMAPPDDPAYIGTPSAFAGIAPPSLHGWTNVVYQTHHYDMLNAKSRDAQHRLVVGALKDIARFQKEWNVPVYAGEYSLYGFYDVWAEWMAGLNALNVSWTNWTYKVRGTPAEPGGGDWGFYNNNQNAVPDINNDSADTIAAKWSRFGTAEFTRNDRLIDVVGRYTSGVIPGVQPASGPPPSVGSFERPSAGPGPDEVRLPKEARSRETVARGPRLAHVSPATDSPAALANRR
jgi:aryl-phospho-beta-D-glucosidase BglC (GH1 family)